MSLKVMEKLQSWLSTYPGWEGWKANVCMLPKGMEEISRHRDVLGNTQTDCRYYVTLLWEMPTLGSPEEDTQRLLKFIQWVQYESATGHAPCLGDVPARERLRTEKGGLTPGTQNVTYTVTLVADFVKAYEL